MEGRGREGSGGEGKGGMEGGRGGSRHTNPHLLPAPMVHNESNLYQIDVVSDHVTCFFLIFTISIWHIYELAQY